jgi:hypothetical protein
VKRDTIDDSILLIGQLPDRVMNESAEMRTSVYGCIVLKLDGLGNCLLVEVKFR